MASKDTNHFNGMVVDGLVGAAPESQIEKLLVRHFGSAAAA